MDKEKEHIIADKTMLRVARITSIVFTPFSIPFLAFLVLFLFSYLRIMPNFIRELCWESFTASPY